jgi:hypothetical protein
MKFNNNNNIIKMEIDAEIKKLELKQREINFKKQNNIQQIKHKLLQRYFNSKNN